MSAHYDCEHGKAYWQHCDECLKTTMSDKAKQGRSKTGANITKCGHGTPSYTACRACQVEVSKIEIDAYMSAQENKPCSD